jgi:hypothetical protein
MGDSHPTTKEKKKKKARLKNSRFPSPPRDYAVRRDGSGSQ